MALKKVSARTEGDIYQGRFFWYEAAGLFINDLKVDQVELEHDVASGVDDVAVFYGSPGVSDAGKPCFADFFQIKYHVDQRDQYCSEGMVDPDFINTKKSLLQRFYQAYKKLRDSNGWFRLYLVSNWRWKPDDPLAKSIISRNGSLPDRFFSDSTGGDLGKVRVKWQTHLSVDDAEFQDFARRLRFTLNHLGQDFFLKSLNDRFRVVGLKPVQADRMTNSYDSLVQQFITSGVNKFNRSGLLDICRREGLVEESRTPLPPETVIGVRSFMRWADMIEEETRKFVCVAENFEGRYIRDPGLWSEKVLPAVRAFLEDSSMRQGRHHVLLECHLSLAFAAGYFLDRKSGVEAYPIQKGYGPRVWMPSGNPPRKEWGWNIESTVVDSSSKDLAVAISITRPVEKDVVRFLEANRLAVRAILHATLPAGDGSSSVEGADHANFLADRLVQAIRAARGDGATGYAHIFPAAPGGFMFFLGQQRSALGPTKLYEHDFEGERGRTYSPSIALP